MRKFNLQLFDDSRAALLRNAIADYALIGTEYELMGTGFTSLDESPNAQTDSETYINEVTASSDITGYETEFPYESRLIPSQKAIYALYKMGRDHATGDAAQLTYVRVDLFNPIGTPSAVSGTLHAVGDPVQGKFDTVTKEFTAGTFSGKYDA